MSRRKFIAGLGGAMMLPFIAQHSNPGSRSLAFSTADRRMA
jgi:hypothetical protein